MQVNFPRYIDRSRLFFIFEIDMLFVFAGSSMGIMWILSRLLTLVLAIPFAFYMGYKIMKFFNVLKYEKSPGFIRHFFYNIGAYKPTFKPSEYPELEKRDNPDFFPSGYIKNFRD